MIGISIRAISKQMQAIAGALQVVSERIQISDVVFASCYIGAVLGYLYAPNLRPLDVSYIFYARDAFPENSFAVEWATHSWSLVHQLGYIGFQLGLGHAEMSSAISAITGAAMVTGLALLIYATTQNGLAAIFAAPLVAAYRFFEVFDTDYISQLIGSSNLSWIGSSLVLLTLGAAATGYYRTVGVLTMLTMCIHFLFGAWLVALISVFLALQWHHKRFDRVSMVAVGLAWGLVIFCLSLIGDYWYFTAESIFPLEPDTYSIWSEQWGLHRVTELNIMAVMAAFIVCAITVAVLIFDDKKFLDLDNCIILVILSSIFFSTIIYIISNLDLFLVRDFLVKIIPGRFMLFNHFFFILLLIAIPLKLSKKNPNINGLVSFTYFIVFIYLFMKFVDPKIVSAAFPWIVISMVYVSYYMTKSNHPFGNAARIVTPLYTLILFSLTMVFFFHVGLSEARIVANKDGDSCKDNVAAEGLVLVASDEQYVISQYKCDIPALIDPTATNSLPYIQWAAPELRRIISVAYGVNFADPPATTRNTGMIKSVAFRQIWESRDAATWREIAQQFGLGSVMVPHDWSLSLGEPIALGETFKLYSLTR